MAALSAEGKVETDLNAYVSYAMRLVRAGMA